MNASARLRSLEWMPVKFVRDGNKVLFSDTNQKVTISEPSRDEATYRFEYFSDFYGGCIIEAKIREDSDAALMLDARTTELKSLELKNTSSEQVLEEAAIRFITRQLKQIGSLASLRNSHSSWSPLRRLLSKAL